MWRIVTAHPAEGYRRYHLHLTPPAETNRQPQIASMWMLIFFFGSVARYRPQAFATMTRGRFGAWINDFVAAQPEQLLFMLASEIRRREVARPAIVQPSRITDRHDHDEGGSQPIRSDERPLTRPGLSYAKRPQSAAKRGRRQNTPRPTRALQIAPDSAATPRD